MTIKDLQLAAACEINGNISGVRGCGKVEIGQSAGYSGTSYVFDAQSGALLGKYDFSDTPWGPCQVFDYVFGQGLFEAASWLGSAKNSSCDTLTACDVCGNTADPSCF